MTQSSSFNYYGHKLHIESEDRLFHKLATTKFAGFQTSATSQLENQSLEIKFTLQPPPTQKDTQKLSHQVWQTKSGGRLLHQYLKTSTTIDYTIKNDQLKSIQLYHRSHQAFTLLNLTQKNLLKRQLYQNLIKMYLEQALLFIITRNKNRHCLHASAVEKDGQVTVFCGLNGVGKSTLAQWLVKHHGFASFADNYLIVNQSKAYRSPDTLRLPPQTVNSLNLTAKSKFGFGKHQLPQPQLSQHPSAPIKTIYWVHQGTVWNFTQKDNQLFHHIKHHERIAGEAVEYAPLGHFFPPQPNKKPPALTYKSLQLGLLDQCESFLENHTL